MTASPAEAVHVLPIEWPRLPQWAAGMVGDDALDLAACIVFRLDEGVAQHRQAAEWRSFAARLRAVEAEALEAARAADWAWAIAYASRDAAGVVDAARKRAEAGRLVRELARPPMHADSPKVEAERRLSAGVAARAVPRSSLALRLVAKAEASASLGMPSGLPEELTVPYLAGAADLARQLLSEYLEGRFLLGDRARAGARAGDVRALAKRVDEVRVTLDRYGLLPRTGGTAHGAD